jgi:predicted phosphodiesterase
MKFAVISDIHGNHEALKAVAADIRKQKTDQVFCLGDVVGYGPEPGKAVDYIMKRKIPCVVGNHELALWNDRVLDRFNPVAAMSVRLTRSLLTRKQTGFLKDLPVNHISGDFLFVHGSPPDSALRYIIEYPSAGLEDLFRSMSYSIAFVGHTHLLRLYAYDGERVESLAPLGQSYPLDRRKKFIINVGSVGQSRDHSSAARYVVFDEEAWSFEPRFVPYDIDKTARLIREKGFPEYNAARLYRG